MTRVELTNFMKKINDYYPEFTFDAGKIDSWFIQFQFYDVEDLYDKLNNHIKSELFGDKPPRINYLLKDLIRSEDKGKYVDHLAMCPICGKGVRISKFDKHYERCNSVQYIKSEMKRLYDKEINEDELFEISDEEFNRRYINLLHRVFERPRGKWQQKILKNILYGAEYSLDEILGSMGDSDENN